MPQTSSPATHQEHLETLQSTVMDILQPKAANNLQWQEKEQQDCDTRGHLTPSLDNRELTSIIFSLVYTLKGLRQEVNELKLQVTEFQREPTSAQQEKEQDRLEEPDRTAQQKEITSLQEALTSARHREQLEKATRQDLERELFHTKSLLRTAYIELNERDTRAKALEGHLHASRAEVQTLTQQFGNIKEELDMVQRELKQSYRLCMDSSKRPPAARHTASSANTHAPVHRYKGGSQNLLFNTSHVSFQETSAAAEGTEFIQTNSEVTLKELNRMARNISAFTPELAEDHDAHAYLKDIDFFLQSWKCVNNRDFICSGSPLAQRLRRAYFGARNEPGMEEDTSFKSLFLQNLHCMNLKQAPEGTQHCHNARPFYRKTLASRGHNHRCGNRHRFQINHWEEPWKRASSACNPTVCPTAVNHILLHTLHT
ncbi:hypothetical protein M9458_055124, partial [Cirrhinus mrigala]